MGSETAYSCPDDCGVELPPCFAAGTPITMADGTTKPIEEVTVGDKVLFGTVRKDEAAGGLWLWAVMDNLTRGGALNAIEIAEALL